MLETQHYHLKKPEPDIDPADVQVINENMDKLDEVVGGHLGDKDRHTSADEKAKIEAELAEKVTAFAPFINSWDELIKQSSGYYMIAPSAVGMPVSNRYWHCNIITMGIETSNDFWSRTFMVYNLNSSNLKEQSPWVKNIVNGEEFDWFQLAAAEPPLWNILPLQPSFVSSIAPKYCRDNVGMITVSGSISKSNELPPHSNEVFGVIPLGFRPNDYIPVIIQQDTGWSTVGTISPTGNLAFLTTVPSGFNQVAPFYFTCTFPVAI